VWLLVASIVVMLAEGVLVAVWGLSVARRTRTLAELAETEQGLIEADIKKLRSALEEMQRLWKPYGRALRWLRHPLTIALLRSYAGRRMRAR
jgi:C4-dicarboxylate-specific signal transduction histidine kinase